MATVCFTPVLGKRIRVTGLDECGTPPEASTESAGVITDGFVTVTITAEVEDGTEIMRRNAAGQLCVNEKLSDSFKRLTVEIEFCDVNPSLVPFVTNAEPYLDYAGDVAGFTLGEGNIDKKFSFELWTGLAGQACSDGVENSGYLLLPFVNAGTVGDITINGEDAATFSMTGAYTRGNNVWGRGPYLSVLDDDGEPAVLPTGLDPFDHLLLMTTGLQPSAGECDVFTMPELPEITEP